MEEYWESRFRNEGAMWKFEPSDSAIYALELFKLNNIKTILIPGFGYGRNAKLFYDAEFRVTGIEISASAIELAKVNGLECTVHHGSVTSMPFDNEKYGGIFCYALLHLLSKPQRRIFLDSCYNQLKPGGLMVFTVISKQSNIFGKGKQVSNDRFEIAKGINVYFYDQESAKKEFADFGIVESRDIEEPIKFMVNEEPLKCILIVCRIKQ
jgi:SAM-dependent methyltransferase